MLCANLLAAIMNWHTLIYGVLPSAAGIPHDLSEFLRDAATAAHLLAHGAVPEDYLPYPPPFLMLSTPFLWVPPHWVYAAWLLAGIAALTVAARAIKLPWPAIFLTLVSPAGLFCMVQGQTGIFISAALLLGLGLAETQPVIAGIAAGCVIMKPQFGVLLPVCYLAARNWRAFTAAAASAVALCLLPTLIFGIGVWRLFFTHHVGAAQSLVGAPWPQDYELTMITVLMTCRSLHAGLALASAIQAAVSVAVAGATWWLWQPRRQLDRITRLAVTLCLVMLVTPYAYIYDLPALTLAIAAYTITGRPGGLAVMTLFWVVTAIYGLLSIYMFISGAFFLGAVLLLVWPWPARGRSVTV
jgi:hypothetical protein